MTVKAATRRRTCASRALALAWGSCLALAGVGVAVADTAGASTVQPQHAPYNFD